MYIIRFRIDLNSYYNNDNIIKNNNVISLGILLDNEINI